MNWDQFLERNKESDVIRVRRADLNLEVSSRVKVFELNKDARVHDKQTLFREFYERAEFGEHFGFNWDALIDCLTEPELPGVAFVVFVFYHFSDFERAAEFDFQTFLDVFGGAASRSKNELKQYGLMLALVEE